MEKKILVSKEGTSRARLLDFYIRSVNSPFFYAYYGLDIKKLGCGLVCFPIVRTKFQKSIVICHWHIVIRPYWSLFLHHSLDVVKLINESVINWSPLMSPLYVFTPEVWHQPISKAWNQSVISNRQSQSSQFCFSELKNQNLSSLRNRRFRISVNVNQYFELCFLIQVLVNWF